MELLVSQLQRDFPQYQFAAGESLCWSSQMRTVFYPTPTHENSIALSWGILHELGHAELGHNHYASDAHLLRQEVAAWACAVRIAEQYAITIDDSHIEDCLNSYRDWLHRRSLCPACSTNGLQASKNLYRCVNCKLTWRVSENRFCRTYRTQQLSAKTKTGSL